MHAYARAHTHTHTHTLTHTHRLHQHGIPAVPPRPLQPPRGSPAAVPAAPRAQARPGPSPPEVTSEHITPPHAPNQVTYPARSARQKGDGDCSEEKDPQDEQEKKLSGEGSPLLPTTRGSIAPHALGSSAAAVSEEMRGGRRSCGWGGKLGVVPPSRPRVDPLRSPPQS